MNDHRLPGPVIVGVDGSQAAIRAAQWAIDEAISRRVPLRLIAVTKSTHPSADDYYRDVHFAEASLRAAQAAVEAIGRPVKIETEMLEGPPGAVLVEESRDADMVCLGSVGIGRYARALLGSTATDLAEKARCPVAVVRTQQHQPPPEINWIVVAINDERDHEVVVEHAMAEAKLRRAPVLALGQGHLGEVPRDGLDRQVQKWRRRYPDVHVYPIAGRADVAHFLKANDERVQLAVIGSSDADQLAEIVGPHGHPIFRHPESSVLVVRG